MTKLLKLKYVVTFMVVLALASLVTLFSVSYAKWTNGGSSRISATVNLGDWGAYQVVLEDENHTTYEMNPTEAGGSTYVAYFGREEDNFKVGFRVYYKGKAVPFEPQFLDEENKGCVTQPQERLYQTEKAGFYTIYVSESEIWFGFSNNWEEFLQNANGIYIITNGQAIYLDEKMIQSATIKLHEGDTFKLYVKGKQVMGNGSSPSLDNQTDTIVNNGDGTFTVKGTDPEKEHQYQLYAGGLLGLWAFITETKPSA